jgi:phosphonate transport system substrate-binding protein
MMRRSIFKAIAICATVVSASIASAETFTFTAIPDADESRLNERFGKVADYLSEQLGVDVKYIPVKSYPAAITAFRNDQVQLAWFGGLSGVQARELVEGSEAIAQGYEDQFFKTYIIANTKANLIPRDEFPIGIEGKTFTFGSKGSTSGRLMPEFYIRENTGKSPEELFSRVGFSGDHSRTIALVESGAYDLGAVNYSVWDIELGLGKIDQSKVNVVWTTPTYPDYQWTIRGDVNARYGDGFKAKVTEALLNMKDEDLLASFPRDSFVPASNADYAPIYETGKSIGLID